MDMKARDGSGRIELPTLPLAAVAVAVVGADADGANRAAKWVLLGI